MDSIYFDDPLGADVIEALTLRSRESLSEDRSAKSPY